MFGSLRRLSASEAAAIRPRRVDVVTVRSGDTVASLARRMAYSNYQAERFQVLHRLAANSRLTPGQKVKIVTYASRCCAGHGKGGDEIGRGSCREGGWR